MPNTLVHFGVQGIGNKLVSRRIDIKWVFLGCIIPDIPWIIRRILVSIVPGIDIYDATLYAAVQASLLYCVLLSLIFALLAEKTRLVFMILAINSVLHLLLDSVEIKWGNGVFLFAPVNWQLFNLDWVWPDSILVGVLSLTGLIFAIWALLTPVAEPLRTKFHGKWRVAGVVILLCLYIGSPLALLDGPYTADIQSIATLKEKDKRTGKSVRIDRAPYERVAEGDLVETLAYETLHVVGTLRATSSQVSLVGRFVDPESIYIEQLHEYNYPWRDLASYIGIALLTLIWSISMVREWRGRGGIHVGKN